MKSAFQNNIGKLNKVRVNNFKVEPIKLKEDTRPIKGGFMFPKSEIVAYVLGKKESGKTHLLFNIMCNRIYTNTTLVIFSSTYEADRGWIEIIKYFEKKEVPVITYNSIYENGVNNLSELVDQLEVEASQRLEEQKKKEAKEKKRKERLKNGHSKALKLDDETDSDDDKKPPEKPPKMAASNYLIIFDDLSDELKEKALTKLIKRHRHYLASIILSNQTLNDVALSARKNLDYWLMFQDIDDKKLKEIYDRCSLAVTLEKFMEMYHDATKEKYNFFYFSCNKSDYRENFNIEYKIEKEGIYKEKEKKKIVYENSESENSEENSDSE
jgi:hypothetical protein